MTELGWQRDHGEGVAIGKGHATSKAVRKERVFLCSTAQCGYWHGTVIAQ